MTKKNLPKIKRDQSPQDIGEMFSVTAATARRWPDDGCPHRRDKSTGRIFFNDGEVGAWLSAEGRSTKPGRPGEPAPEWATELGGDKDYWLARKYRNDCLQSEGKLVDKEEYRSAWMTEFQTIKHKFLGMGAILAPQLFGLDAGEIQKLIDERTEQIFRELSAE